MKALLKFSVSFTSFQCHCYPANIEQLELIFPARKKKCGLRTLPRKYDRLDRIRLRGKINSGGQSLCKLEIKTRKSQELHWGWTLTSESPRHECRAFALDQRRDFSRLTL